MVKRTVDKAREVWIRKVAIEGEAAVKMGRLGGRVSGSCSRCMTGADPPG